MRYDWKTLFEQLQNCERCGLCKTRNSVVAGEGNIHAEVMFVGEGPGHDEDMQGRPFVGAAGQLLDKMLHAIDLKREDIYISNIVKCRPPRNRVPSADEAQACLPFLRAQYALVHPKIIVCLGATAAKYIYDPNVRITKDRGVWKEKMGLYILPTYHPAALLRDPSKKREAWVDLQLLRDKLKELR